MKQLQMRLGCLKQMTPASRRGEIAGLGTDSIDAFAQALHVAQIDQIC